MTQEEFIEVLDKKGYSYEIEGDKIVVTDKGGVDLNSLISIPPGVEFRNGGGVYLRNLTSIPPGVEFRNGEGVYLRNLTSIPPGIAFRNSGDVSLESITIIPNDVVFENGGHVFLKNDWFWFVKRESNNKGIDSKRLLNAMIKQGVFER